MTLFTFPRSLWSHWRTRYLKHWINSLGFCFGFVPQDLFSFYTCLLPWLWYSLLCFLIFKSFSYSVFWVASLLKIRNQQHSFNFQLICDHSFFNISNKLWTPTSTWLLNVIELCSLLRVKAFQNSHHLKKKENQFFVS
jgi:hypothetical protein